jgi:DNA replication licensing factor MCM3
LLFIVTDDVDEQRDRLIADHVLRMHRYLRPGLEEGTPIHDNLDQPLSVEGPVTVSANAEDDEISPFEKYDPLFHIGIVGAKTRTRRGTEKKKELLKVSFVKKYIQYAKSKSAPALTKGAADHIVQVYAQVRNEEQEGNKKKVIEKTHRCHRLS